MAKPTKLPRWADIGLVDPTTGINNVVEPTEARKDNGFSPAGSFPTRQEMNWLFNNIYQWVNWLDTELLQSGTFEAKVTTDDFDDEYTFNIEWQKLGDIVSIKFPVLYQTASGSGTRLSIYPSGAAEWPSEILPNGGSVTQPFYVFVDSGGPIVRAIGSIQIESTATNEWDLAAPDANGNILDNNFTDTNFKGWERQTITYSTKTITV